MKVNNAPEKIYIFENPILDFTKLSVKQSDTDIEYTRTDAFIDKACKFFYDKLNSGNIDCRDIEKFIEDFINIIK